jgi:hypothetical protein
MTGCSLSPIKAALLLEIRLATSSGPSLESAKQTVAEVLSRDLGRSSWTGFYTLDLSNPNAPILWPFVADPTPHIRIPATQGICGAAVASGETVIVDDVNAILDTCRARSRQNQRSWSQWMPTESPSVRSTSTTTILPLFAEEDKTSSKT